MARVVKSSRLFKNDLLEAATHVHPLTPLVIWGPVVAYLLYKSFTVMESLTFFIAGVLGFLVWTLTEYLLHRFAFHYEAKGRVGKYLVFLLHGIHHDEPDDATRLVMPPVPAIVLAGSLYGLFYLVLGPQLIDPFYAFFLIGYLCYDYIHYATHHFACKSRVMRALKRHHMLHHHLVHDGKYGVSSPLWDIVFRTNHEPAKTP